MASNSGMSKPGPGVVLLTKVKRRAALGPMTMAFFRKGEDLEATEFENLPHDDPALVPPKLGFRSFDRVPRHRLPQVIAFLVVIAAVLSVVGWPQVRVQAARVATVGRAKASVEWIRLKEIVRSRHAAP